jgi:hypothetical protein
VVNLGGTKIDANTTARIASKIHLIKKIVKRYAQTMSANTKVRSLFGFVKLFSNFFSKKTKKRQFSANKFLVNGFFVSFGRENGIF